jgi:hypothetical protein
MEMEPIRASKEADLTLFLYRGLARCSFATEATRE